MASYFNYHCPCDHRVVQKRLTLSRGGRCPCPAVLMVYQRLSVYSVARVFIAGHPFRLGLSDVSGTRDACLAGRHSVLFGDLAVVQRDLRRERPLVLIA